MNPAPRSPGIYEGVPIDQYHGGAGISKSGLDDIDASPLRYWGTHLDPQRPRERSETAAQLIGNLAHCAILEPAEFGKRYRVGPSVSNKNVKLWQDFKKECEADGAQAIDADQYAMAHKMREQVMLLPDVAAALAVGTPEASAYWEDPATGVLCRCRPDWVHPVGAMRQQAILMDVKTYSDASEHAFAKQAARMRYDVQDAYYTDGWELASGQKVLAFLFITVETAYPFVANVMMLDEPSKAAGKRKYRRNLDTYAECVKTNTWPGYAPGVRLISLPNWAKDAS